MAPHTRYSRVLALVVAATWSTAAARRRRRRAGSTSNPAGLPDSTPPKAPVPAPAEAIAQPGAPTEALARRAALSERRVPAGLRRRPQPALLPVSAATTPFAELVTYYRNLLKERGNLVFEVPPTHIFETGRFRDETMAFPPSVTIKA